MRVTVPANHISLFEIYLTNQSTKTFYRLNMHMYVHVRALKNSTSQSNNSGLVINFAPGPPPANASDKSEKCHIVGILIEMAGIQRGGRGPIAVRRNLKGKLSHARFAKVASLL